VLQLYCTALACTALHSIVFRVALHRALHCIFVLRSSFFILSLSLSSLSSLLFFWLSYQKDIVSLEALLLHSLFSLSLPCSNFFSSPPITHLTPPTPTLSFAHVALIFSSLPPLYSFFTPTLTFHYSFKIGHLGAHYLSAAGLASVTQNVTGNAILYGMSGGMSTIAGQAFGAKDYLELGLTLQRALIILPLFVCVPVTFLWLNVEAVYKAVGMDPAVAVSSAHYLVLLLPGIWCMSGSVCLQTWLHAQKVSVRWYLFCCLLGYHRVVAYVATIVLLRMWLPCFRFHITERHDD
jgi:hypothetical protein